MSLGICKTLAQGIGPSVARHKSTLLPSMINTMADAKVFFSLFDYGYPNYPIIGDFFKSIISIKSFKCRCRLCKTLF